MATTTKEQWTETRDRQLAYAERQLAAVRAAAERFAGKPAAAKITEKAAAGEAYLAALASAPADYWTATSRNKSAFDAPFAGALGKKYAPAGINRDDVAFCAGQRV